MYSCILVDTLCIYTCIYVLSHLPLYNAHLKQDSYMYKILTFLSLVHLISQYCNAFNLAARFYIKLIVSNIYVQIKVEILKYNVIPIS